MFKRAAWCTLFLRHLRELGLDDEHEERLLHIAFHEWSVDHHRNPMQAAHDVYTAALNRAAQPLGPSSQDHKQGRHHHA